MSIKKVDGSEWNLDFSSTVINYCFWITKGIILDETRYCCPE